MSVFYNLEHKRLEYLFSAAFNSNNREKLLKPAKVNQKMLIINVRWWSLTSNQTLEGTGSNRFTFTGDKHVIIITLEGGRTSSTPSPSLASMSSPQELQQTERCRYHSGQQGAPPRCSTSTWWSPAAAMWCWSAANPPIWPESTTLTYLAAQTKGCSLRYR